MTAPQFDWTEGGRLQPRRPSASETPCLRRWLDRHLRRGEAGRLAMEYPLNMGLGGSRRHCAIFERGRPVAHAMSHRLTQRAQGRRLELGLIGNVLTDPASRGQGYATRCVDAAARELAEDGAAVGLLWSDATALYARSGFQPAGRETLWDISEASLTRPSGCPEKSQIEPVHVSRVHPRDLAAMEALYAAKPLRVDRLEGALGLLCGAPETRVVVARRKSDGRVIAYAALGRGDDFRGVIHEWAGHTDAVLSCVRWLRRHAGAHSLLSSPIDEGVATALQEQRAPANTGIFALARIFDAARLWRSIGPRSKTVQFSSEGDGVRVDGPSGTSRLSHADALELFFGEGPCATPALPRAERRALDRCLPWPLYVWGFDSI